jgi:hypothetical protein
MVLTTCGKMMTHEQGLLAVSSGQRIKVKRALFNEIANSQRRSA